MDFQLPISIPPLEKPIGYRDKILLVGSCFTEHIGDYLKDLKFDILQNPNGIIFDPQTVATSLVSYIQKKHYIGDDLFYLNELWQSWQHHGVYTHIDQQACLDQINASQNKAHAFLKEASWLIITLGTSFSYRLADNNHPVANCHRAPSPWFTKHLMTIEETCAALDNCIFQLFQFNQKLQIVFTVSPVRHIRDGIVENNRSKARLLEAVHHLVNKFDRLHYFPAYELIIDVLRDYRFYDIDLVHPNYQATDFVLEKFAEYGIEESSKILMQEMKKIGIARRHKPMHPETKAHRNFMESHYEKVRLLKIKYPFLNLEEELNYFSNI